MTDTNVKSKEKTDGVDLSRLKDIQSTLTQNALSNMKEVFKKKSFDHNPIDPELIKKVKSTKRKNDIEVDVTKDGIEYYNIDYTAKTNVGRMLTPDSNIPFVHPELGYFKSLTSFRYFLCGDQNEEIRSKTSGQCRKEYRGKKITEVELFKTIFAHATWYRIIQSENLINALVSTKDKPLKMFYVRDGRVFNSRDQDWYVKILNEIRRTLIVNNETILLNQELKDGEELEHEFKLQLPNFTFLD